MAGHVIHLAVAKRYLDINKAKNYSEEYKTELLLGALAPDIFVDKAHPRRMTHFEGEFAFFSNLPLLKTFLTKYDFCLNEPFVKGYFIHILTDYYFYGEYLKTRFDIMENKGYTSFRDKYVYILKTSNIKMRYEDIYTKSLQDKNSGIYEEYGILNESLINKYNVELKIVRDAIEYKSYLANKIDELGSGDLANILYEFDKFTANYTGNNDLSILSYESIVEFIEIVAVKIDKFLLTH